jgi:hypothetical protein
MKGFVLSSKNFKLLGISVVLLLVGYFLLGQGPVDNPLSLTVAPLILVGVYCILLPWAAIAGGNKRKHEKSAEKTGV